MPVSEVKVEEKMKKILAATLRIKKEEIKPDMTLEELGADSLDTILLILHSL